MKNYREETKKFFKRIHCNIDIIFIGKQMPKYWNTNNEYHNTYKVILKRNGKQFTYYFYDSIHNTRNNICPDEYDVTACLEKYDLDFDYFCSLCNYNENDKKAEKHYNAVLREIEGVKRIFGDVMEELREICC